MKKFLKILMLLGGMLIVLLLASLPFILTFVYGNYLFLLFFIPIGIGFAIFPKLAKKWS